MTIKLHSLSRWALLPNDRRLVLDGGAVDHERRIRLSTNCNAETALYIKLADGEHRLLAVVPAGLETVEFSAAGRLEIESSAQGEQEVWYQTADLEPTFVEVRDPVIFTELAQRRTRNPELEAMMYRMQINIERRMAEQASEHNAALARMQKEMKDGRPAETIVSNAPGAAAGNSSGAVRASQPPAERSGEKAGKADGGGEQGNGGDEPPFD